MLIYDLSLKMSPKLDKIPFNEGKNFIAQDTRKIYYKIRWQFRLVSFGVGRIRVNILFHFHMLTNMYLNNLYKCKIKMYFVLFETKNIIMQSISYKRSLFFKPHMYSNVSSDGRTERRWRSDPYSVYCCLTFRRQHKSHYKNSL